MANPALKVTAERVEQCKKMVAKNFEPMLYDAAKTCQVKSYHQILEEKTFQENQCLQQGPSDCAPIKEQLKAFKANQKHLIQTTKQQLKDGAKKQREINAKLKKNKDTDRSQHTAIQECLSKKNKPQE